jgi:hypothetical protein
MTSLFIHEPIQNINIEDRPYMRHQHTVDTSYAEILADLEMIFTYLRQLMSFHSIKSITHKICKIHKKKIINKPIDETKNVECPITYEIIGPDDKYVKCDYCKYNISHNAMEIHLTYNNFDCPMCRNPWTSNIIYINKSVYSKISLIYNTIKCYYRIYDEFCNIIPEYNKNINFMNSSRLINCPKQINGRYKKRYFNNNKHLHIY